VARGGGKKGTPQTDVEDQPREREKRYPRTKKRRPGDWRKTGMTPRILFARPKEKRLARAISKESHLKGKAPRGDFVRARSRGRSSSSKKEDSQGTEDLTDPLQVILPLKEEEPR